MKIPDHGERAVGGSNVAGRRAKVEQVTMRRLARLKTLVGEWEADTRMEAHLSYELCGWHGVGGKRSAEKMRPC